MRLVALLTLILGFALPASAAWAVPNIIVFDLESTLVQRIHRRAKANYDAKELLTAPTLDDESGFTKNEDKLYFVIPGARQLLGLLLSQANPPKLHIATRFAKDTTVALLQAFKLPNGKPLKDVVETIVTLEDLDRSKVDRGAKKDPSIGARLDLKRYAADTQQVTFVTGTKDPIVIDDQKASVIALGDPYYFYPSFELSEVEKARASTSMPLTYAPNVAAWKADQQKLARLQVGFDDAAAAATPAAFRDTVRAALKEDPARVGQIGEQMLAGSFKKLAFAWTYREIVKADEATGTPGKKRVVGCERIVNRTAKPVGAATIEECVAELPTAPAWNRNHELKRVSGCWLTDLDGNGIRETELARCLEKLPRTAAWVGREAKACAEYTQGELYFIRDVEAKLCGEFHAVLDERTGTVSLLNRIWLNVSLGRPIPAILNLPPSGQVPAEVYRDYSSEDIALSLIQRLRKLIDGRQDGEPNFDFVRNTEITMAFKHEYFDSIRDKCFLNQHQVGHSQGAYNPSSRTATEYGMMRATLMPGGASGELLKKVLEVHPKYSYLSPQAPTAGGSNAYGSYGNMVALFKDEVKARSTFTPEDSLGTYGSLHTFFWLDSPKPPQKWGHYWEAQVWGPLCFSHVEAFLHDCPGISNRPPGEFLGKMKATGIPVHRCVMNAAGFWSKGEAL